MHSAALGDPGSWNQYAYVGGDPLNFADPGGTNRLACDQYTLEGTCVGQSLGGGGVAWFTNFWWSPEGTLMAIATSSYGSPESAADPQGSSTGGMPSLAVLRHIFLDPAIQGAETLLNDPDCQSLFDTLSMDSNFGTTNPAQILQGAVDHNQVWFGPFGADVGQSVPAQTTGTNGMIQIASNRGFVTGVAVVQVPDPDPRNPLNFTVIPIAQTAGFNGLTQSEINEVMLIHELLHFTGTAGADNNFQQITLGNGEVVSGSVGITEAVRTHCLHH